MKGKKSAGILLFKILDTELKILLVHPGGPFWAKKEQGAWSIPKGEFQIDEEPLKAAQREFLEETGEKVEGDFMELGTCEVVWPPRSGKIISIPEIDRAAWFSIEQAMEYINEGQQPFLIRLLKQYELNNK